MKYLPVVTLALIAFKLPEIIRAIKEPRSLQTSSAAEYNKAALSEVACAMTQCFTSTLTAGPANSVSFTVFAPAIYPDVRVTLEAPANSGGHRNADLDRTFLTNLVEAATESITTSLGRMVAHAVQAGTPE